MACNLPHTVKQVQNYVKKQVDIDDKECQDAIVEVIKKFEQAKLCKQRLIKRYIECKDISVERKFVIDQFLYAEFRKDAAVVDDWNSEDEWQLSRLEAQLEEEKFASFDPYDDGYDSNNTQTWDHPDYN